MHAHTYTYIEPIQLPCQQPQIWSKFLYIYIYIYTHTHINTYIYIHTYLHRAKPVTMPATTNLVEIPLLGREDAESFEPEGFDPDHAVLCMCLYVYAHMYVCIRTHTMYVCIRTHTRIYTRIHT